MLTIRTWLNAIDATSAVRHYQIMRDGSLIGRARTLQAWTDAASGDPIPMK
jgi:acyl-CoA thioesterase FadM